MFGLEFMNSRILNRITDLNRRNKIFIIAFFDFCLSLAAFFIAFILIEKKIPDILADLNLILVALATSCFAVSLFYALRLYNDIFRYTGLMSFARLTFGVIVSASIFYLLSIILLDFTPKRLIFLYMMSFIFSTISMRIFVRILLKDSISNDNNASRVLIYGAGASGHQVMQMMRNSVEYKPVGFLEDNKSKHGLNLGGLKIYPSANAPYLCQKLKIDTILLAIPSASRTRRRDVVFGLEDCDVAVKTLPHIADLLDGSQSISDIQNIDITELLGREPVEPNQKLFSRFIEDQTILVTGGAGSIGSELCRQILKSQPKQLIIFDSSEYSLYAIEQELSGIIKTQQLATELIPILGSVQSKARINFIFNKYRIDTIYHAAAYKHVPLVEQNIMEGVTNNIFGTLNIAQAAINHNVKHVTLVSTDKAVRPTNVMGASKRMAELVLQALANEKHKTCFSIVRFGNVLGSSGSVVPLFKKQIEQGGPITVTDPEIIRFFMTIPEAAQLVIQAGAMADGGEVYVLDMGDPVKIYDLARQMINLSDLTIKDASNPQGDIEIIFSGLRPGEKLYEELLIGDNVSGTQHKRIMAAKEIYLNWQNLENILDRIKTACDLYDIDSLHEIFNHAPMGYNHSGIYVDPMFNSSIVKPSIPMRLS